MPLYQITRDFSGATGEDVMAAGLRAKMCVMWYPGMRWIETFFDAAREVTTCIYEAVSVEDVRTHSKISGIPCGEIIEVDVVRPEDIGIDDASPESLGLVQPPVAPSAGPTQLYQITRDLSSWTDEELAAAAVRSRLSVPWWPGLRWIESFYDRESGGVTCIYEAQTPDDIRNHSSTASLPVSEIRAVELILPEELEAPALEAGALLE
jgi:hypothetical protein